jgi:uncharacterized membrane protein
MHKGRLEAFSDGVIAIIITIMVLELQVPKGADPHALRGLLHEFLTYALSFLYVGIYWNNHHHLFQAVQHVRGAVLWANLHLLFWLSLFPFVTGWLGLGEEYLSTWPVVIYGGVLIMAAIAYYVLVRVLLVGHGPGSALARAIGSDFKGKTSVVIYAVGIALAFYRPWLGNALYFMVALIWLCPDRRIEKTLAQ